MPWVKLSQLPGMRAFSEGSTDLVRWEIRDGSVWFYGTKRLRNANAECFELWCDEFWNDEGTLVARDDSHVYHGSSVARNIDLKTFEALGCRYFRDKKFAYYEGGSSVKPLQGQDVANFKVLGNGYARDAVHGYIWGRPLKSCSSPLSLQLIESEIESSVCYSRDADHVYFEGAVLRNADLATWELLPQGFSRDAKHAYFAASKLPGVKADSWELLEHPYSRDSKSVYTMNFRLRDAEPAKFRVLRENYSTDGIRVYFVGSLVEGADAATFKVTSKGRATDKHGVIERGFRVKK